ncbi:hypothetical protein OHS70_38580 (plasmid) [Streptomyces sp. NBC_00390]|uniref:hypothetical protein n=1 Tax=Streptomyces sp. NBC_00390 TaxID=2975736 RepID=UPI002E24C4F3
MTLTATETTMHGMASSGLSAPIVREWTRRFDMHGDARLLARIHTRTQVTLLRWGGNVDAATEVARHLVCNAYTHAHAGPCPMAIGFRLAVTETDELLVEVSDPLAEFPNFDDAVQGSQDGSGFWEIRQHGGQLSWFLLESGGKTVRALMAPGQVPA